MISVFIGISGAGKTTLMNSMITPNSVIVSRDSARKLLFGVDQNDAEYFERADLKECELLVTETLDDITYNALNKGRDILMDNTHLEKRFIDDIIFRFNHYSAIELIFVDVSLNEAKRRVAERNGWLESQLNYIDRQFSQYGTLKKELHCQKILYPQSAPQVKFDSNLPSTYIVDIDGTVALKGDRGIYDDSLLHLDTEIKEVGHVVKALSQTGHKIVFVSGRSEVCKDTTTKWLKDNDLWMDDSEIFLRKEKDSRNDAIVKEEIVINDLLPNFNVVAVIDDRIGVSRNFHKLGMFVLNVNQNFIKF